MPTKKNYTDDVGAWASGALAANKARMEREKVSNYQKEGTTLAAELAKLKPESENARTQNSNLRKKLGVGTKYD